MNKFRPTYMIDSVDKIPFELLERDNIKGIILDVDNTLSPAYKSITKENFDWIKTAKSLGYKVCILSNTLNFHKIKSLMVDLDIYGLYFARKPSLKGFEMAKTLLDLPKENLVMVGDQIFTDVVGANGFNIKSILVKPLTKIEGPFTLIKRPFERIIMNRLKRADKKDD